CKIPPALSAAYSAGPLLQRSKTPAVNAKLILKQNLLMRRPKDRPESFPESARTIDYSLGRHAARSIVTNSDNIRGARQGRPTFGADSSGCDSNIDSNVRGNNTGSSARCNNRLKPSPELNR